MIKVVFFQMQLMNNGNFNFLQVRQFDAWALCSVWTMNCRNKIKIDALFRVDQKFHDSHVDAQNEARAR